MLFTPTTRDIITQNNLPAAPSVSAVGVTVTASATIHTKGAYATLIAATAYDSFGFFISIIGVSGSAVDTSTLLDIAIGAAGLESNIINNLIVGQVSVSANNAGPHFIYIPIFIPAGSRLSARCQSIVVSKSFSVGLTMLAGADAPMGIYNNCDTYGANTALSGGTPHLPVQATFSAPATIGTASRDYHAIMLRACLPNSVVTLSATYFVYSDPNADLVQWWFAANTSEISLGPYPMWAFRTRISQGDIIKIKARSSAVPQSIDVAFYCFY